MHVVFVGYVARELTVLFGDSGISHVLSYVLL